MSQVTFDNSMTDCPYRAEPGPGHVRNWLFASAGVVCVGLGAVGVVVPGLPTTVFLIIASWLFTKSCPWLERRLIRNRFFGPYLRYVDGQTGMPRKAKALTLVVMWGFVGLSCALLAQRVPGLWLPMLVGAAAGLGSFFVIRQGWNLLDDASSGSGAELGSTKPAGSSASVAA